MTRARTVLREVLVRVECASCGADVTRSVIHEDLHRASTGHDEFRSVYEQRRVPSPPFTSPLLIGVARC